MKTYVKLFGIAGFVLFSSCALAENYNTIVNVTSCYISMKSGSCESDVLKNPKCEKPPPTHIGAKMWTCNDLVCNSTYGQISVGESGNAPILSLQRIKGYFSSIKYKDKSYHFVTTKDPQTFYVAICYGGPFQQYPIFLSEDPR